jgi:hypothetical protein
LKLHSKEILQNLLINFLSSIKVQISKNSLLPERYHLKSQME